jgi:cytochrome c553
MPPLRLQIIGILLSTIALAAAAPSRAGESAGEEFFEKKVRPVLVEKCLKCHGNGKKRGSLSLESRQGALTGGDNGPALVPGKPEKSRLVEAIHYTNVDLQMPPKGKLSDAAIRDLTEWVKMGAPWPTGSIGKTAGPAGSFDLGKRKAAHWAWRPVQSMETPEVRQADWPLADVDRFILHRLEEKGLSPAPPADRRTWLRRVTFDLVGLPPTPEEIDAFLKDQSEDACAIVVDRLLASPHFGERWGRHWLDLVRYAETRGHEYDYPIPNAYQYRDYVLRAFNADVPYDQFVREHVAGDLLDNPRRNPEKGFNESLLGTGFWFLGESLHSPVDTMQDEADRFDNKIDVFGKTFLGLTVACARCHDHKFDAISTRDYYALFGILQSSSYRLARFDTAEDEKRIAAELAVVRQKARRAAARAVAEGVRPPAGRLADYLLAAREAIQAGPEYATAAEDIVFEDFESGTYDGWEVTGTAFGDRPQTLATIAPYQGKINAVGKYFVNSHNIRHGGGVSEGDAHKGTMTSRPFTIRRRCVTMLVGGGAHVGRTCVDLVIDGKTVLSATGRNSNQMFPIRWDVQKWHGQTARIRIVDDESGGWGNIGVDQIIFTDGAKDTVFVRPEDFSPAYRRRLTKTAAASRLNPAFLMRWTAHLLNAARDEHDPFHTFARLATEPNYAACLAAMKDAAERGRKRLAETRLPKDAEVVVDYSTARAEDWLTDGGAFGTAPVHAGELRPVGEEFPIWTIARRSAAEVNPRWPELTMAPGTENDPGALGSMFRAGRTLRTPSFLIGPGRVWYLVRGFGQAYASVNSHVMIAGPLHANVVKPLQNATWHWVGHDLTRYRGCRVHIEFTARDLAPFGVALVVQSASPPPVPAVLDDLLPSIPDGDLTGLSSVAAAYQKRVLNLLDHLAAEGSAGPEDAALAGWLLGHLDYFDNGKLMDDVSAAEDQYRREEARLLPQLHWESHLAPAMLDGSGMDGHVFIRGSPKAQGVAVPRRFLEALAGDAPLPAAHGSGRLELARQMTDPSLNPFISRVAVNRVWHHLFGQGIVPSVDNFGVLGEAPTHPELLDYLADRFVKDGWSIKRLIRLLVLSQTYRMSSHPGPKADEADPQNTLLHRMRIRRLEGEAVRDALLTVSGRLNPKLYGPSVGVYLTEFQQGRGRPASGPLDGDGRRSVYLAVRRNFLSALLLAFDTPIPFSTVGRRSVSNVPAQALILMNDPLVHQQAGVWARRELDAGGSAEERVQRMYLRAFGRPATDAECGRCAEFLRHNGVDDPAAWTGLAHALFNTKEFLFLY